jgi:phage gp45-like
VVVDFIGGDKEVGVIRGGVFNREDRCLVVPSGEFWLVHQSGAYFKLTNDGKAKVGGSEIDLIGFINAVGSMNVSANLAVGTGASGSFTTPTGQIVSVSGGIITNIF